MIGVRVIPSRIFPIAMLGTTLWVSGCSSTGGYATASYGYYGSYWNDPWYGNTVIVNPPGHRPPEHRPPARPEHPIHRPPPARPTPLPARPIPRSAPSARPARGR